MSQKKVTYNGSISFQSVNIYLMRLLGSEWRWPEGMGRENVQLGD